MLKSSKLRSTLNHNIFYYGIYVLYFLLSLILHHIFPFSEKRLYFLLSLPAIAIFFSLNLEKHVMFFLIFFHFLVISFYHRLISPFNIFVPLLLIILLIKNKIMIKIKINFINVAFILIITSILISTFFAKEKNPAFMWVINTFPYLFIYLFIKNYINSKNKFINFILILSFGSFIPILCGAFQVFSSDKFYRIGSIIGNINVFGAYSSFFLLLYINLIPFVNKILKILFITMSSITFIVILNTFSRGALIGLILSLLIYFLIISSKKKNIIVAICIFFFLMLFLFQSEYIKRFENIKVKNYTTSEIERIGLMYAGLQLFNENLLVGVGVNNYRTHFRKYFPFKKLFPNQYSHYHSHNIIINIMAEQGLLGIITAMFLLIALIQKIMYLKRKSFDKLSYHLSIFLIIFGLYAIVHQMFDVIFTVYGRHICYMLIVFYFVILNKNEEYILKLGKLF